MPSRTSLAPDPLPPRESSRASAPHGRPGRRARAPLPRSGPGLGPQPRSGAPRSRARARSPVYRTVELREAATRPRSRLFLSGRRLAEARPPKQVEDVVPRGLLVVPGQRDVADEVRARGLEPLV